MNLNFICLLIVAVLCCSVNGFPDGKKVSSDRLHGRYSRLLDSVTSAITSDSEKYEQRSTPQDKNERRKAKVAPDIKYPRNCYDLYRRGDPKDEHGIEIVYPYKNSPTWGIEVVCDQETEDGGWTVIQTRKNIFHRENFDRTWLEYSLGFGNLSGEFWLGLENMNALTNSLLMELRVDFEDERGEESFAKYDYFSVGKDDENYKLKIGGYFGDAGDGLSSHDGEIFSTKDRLHSRCAEAEKSKGGWWYSTNSVINCHRSYLNGHPYVGHRGSDGDAINWEPFRGRGIPVAQTKMMIRPAFRG